jgi:hypothetical protein
MLSTTFLPSGYIAGGRLVSTDSERITRYPDIETCATNPLGNALWLARRDCDETEALSENDRSHVS